MKRIVAKEFLLLIGCLVVLILVILFGWIRNSWFVHRADSIGREQVEQSRVLDSLGQLTLPRHLDFLDLFEPEFVRKNCSVFLVSPFWTMEPFFALTMDEFMYGRDNSSPQPPFNRRYLLCMVKALDVEGYWSHDQLTRLAMNCGQPPDKMNQLVEVLRSRMTEQAASWRPPSDASEIYNPIASKARMTTWKEVLKQRGVSNTSIDSSLMYARSDTSRSIPLLIAIRGLLCDSMPYAALRSGFEYLRGRRVLRCNVDDLLYTLQDKAVPPTQEALDAFAKQKTTVYELRTQQNAARASLWSAAKQWEVVKWSAIVLFLLVWPLRLLVLGTRWAVRTLRA